MILNLYMARKYLTAFALVFGVMLGILLLIDMVEQLRQFSGRPLGLGEATHLALLRLPASLYAVLPLVAMLATLAMFMGLARSSELVVTRAAGRSALHVVAAPVLVALAIGAFALAALNPIVAATSTQYELRAARISGTDDSVLSVSREGLWLREGVGNGQRVISASGASAGGARLHQVSILGFDEAVGPVERYEAAEAELVAGSWLLHDAKAWKLDEANPELGATMHDELRLPTELNPARIRDSFSAPGSIAIWDLPGFIAALDRAGLSAREHRVWLQMELAMPLFLVAMVLLGAGFTMGHYRSGHRGLLVLVALLCGFAAFFLRNLAQVLGENGHIPVALAGWSPPVVAILLALALLLHLEEG
jgi:lipopolysaccharide export system permease protein